MQLTAILCGHRIARVGAGRPPNRCEACRVVVFVPRPCDNCGTAFVPGSVMARKQRFCSATCREASWLAVANARYQSRAQVYEYTCAECGEVFGVSSVTPRQAGAGQGRRRFCSHQCKTGHLFRLKYGAGGGRRHGRVNGKARLAVFERDDWRCQLCGAVVDRSLRFPSPGSVTVDHTVPLADGGPHEPSNWQTAHLICNVEKGNLDRKRKVA